MKIFVSSLIRGMEEFRAAAVRAIETLGHEPVTAEDFPAGDNAPRIACLVGVRESSLVVLLLGDRYGEPLPPSSLSATHQEYREARGNKPVLAFVQSNVSREERQSQFVSEVEDWETGHFRAEFATPDDLERLVTRAVHRHEISVATAPIDTAALLQAAIELLQARDENRYTANGPQLRIAVAGGPIQNILRPSEIEDESLKDAVLKEALFGDRQVFQTRLSNEVHNSGERLLIEQPNGNRFILNELGQIVVGMQVANDRSGIPAIIEEDVIDAIERALGFASKILEIIDSSQRLSRLAIAAVIRGAEYVAWRTRAEQSASPNSVSYSAGFSNREQSPVHRSPPDVPRAALDFNSRVIAVDLTTLLRRRGNR